jgi:hypothetical protein
LAAALAVETASQATQPANGLLNTTALNTTPPDMY